ncbi:MAG TPA: hypothetical protein VH539_12710, partial [Gemmatimonadaceae bacterium]
MLLVVVIAVAGQLSSAPRGTNAALMADDSLRTRIERRVAQVPGATVGVAFRDLVLGDTMYLGADER